MKIFQQYKIYLLALVMCLTGACDKEFLDVNVDPNNPTEAPLGQLLTNSQVTIANTVGLSTAGFSSHLSVFIHQTTRRAEPDAYGTSGDDFMIGEAWNNLYAGALQDLEIMIETGTESGDLQYVGVAQILKAYAFSVMVDVWGDIPFSEANEGPELRFPTFDNDADIYPQLFELIDAGIANLENEEAENVNIPGADDLIYGGNIGHWVKAAKTLKLKLYNQIRLVSDVSAEVNALITEGDLISSIDEAFELPYGTSNNPDNRHPGYIGEYPSPQKTYYISPYFYEILNGISAENAIFNGIEDPRIPYYFFNQLTAGEPAENPTAYRRGDFVSIKFASNHPNRDQAMGSSQTVLGLYPIGGRYDDGEGGAVTSQDEISGGGDVSQRLISHFIRLYTEAELAVTGVSGGDARDLLMAAIEASFAQVMYIVNNSTNNNTVPEIPADAITNYMDAVMLKYDAASAEGKLEIILTQKWIASFGNSVEPYNDYRRTGYPRIFDPNTDTDPLTVLSRDFPVALPYRTLDLTLNPNAPAQKNITTEKVFWDNE